MNTDKKKNSAECALPTFGEFLENRLVQTRVSWSSNKNLCYFLNGMLDTFQINNQLPVNIKRDRIINISSNCADMSSNMLIIISVLKKMLVQF